MAAWVERRCVVVRSIVRNYTSFFVSPCYCCNTSVHFFLLFPVGGVNCLLKTICVWQLCQVLSNCCVQGMATVIPDQYVYTLDYPRCCKEMIDMWFAVDEQNDNHGYCSVPFIIARSSSVHLGLQYNKNDSGESYFSMYVRQNNSHELDFCL